MGILDGLSGAKGSPRVSAPAKKGFRDYVTVFHGDAAYDTAAEVFAAIGLVGVVSRIWERTIPAQQLVAWGFGSPALPENQGYMWFYAASAAAFDVGTLRLVQEDFNRTHTVTVAAILDTQLHAAVAAIADASLIDKRQMIALPEKTEFDLVGEDSRLALNYIPVVLVVETQCAFSIPVTVYQ